MAGVIDLQHHSWTLSTGAASKLHDEYTCWIKKWGEKNKRESQCEAASIM